MDERTRRKTLDAATVSGISRVTWIGFWLNAFLAAFKIAAGILGNSRAVVADGVHSLSDLITDVALLVGVHFWVAPPDDAHPYGHKRLESLLSLAIGIILAVAGAGIAIDAVQRLAKPGEEHAGSLLALGAALLSVVVKEALFRWTLTKGRQLRSSAVEANAWEHRSDAIASLPVALTVAVTLWFPSLAALDLLGAVVLCGFIEYAAWKICKPAVDTLLDKGADPALSGRIIVFVSEAPGVECVHALRSRYLGQDLTLDLHICVNGNLTVTAGNAIAHNLEDALYSDRATEVLGVAVVDAVIHVDPWLPDEPEIR